MIAFAPAAVLGFLFDSVIEEALFAPWPIVAAWFIGGVGILALEQFGLIPRRSEVRSDGKDPLIAITYRQALIIGLAQTVAMWPGTSPVARWRSWVPCWSAWAWRPRSSSASCSAS